MSPTKQTIDNEDDAERVQRGWDEVYYGEEWPSDEEMKRDAQQREIEESDE